MPAHAADRVFLDCRGAPASPSVALPAEVVHGPRVRPAVALTFHGQGDAAVACERDGLEEHLGQHDRRSAVQIHAALEACDVRHEIAEVAEAPFADRRA